MYAFKDKERTVYANLLFLEIIAEFSTKLIKQDKEAVLVQLDNPDTRVALRFHDLSNLSMTRASAMSSLGRYPPSPRPIRRLNFLNKQIANHDNVEHSVYWSSVHCYKASLECTESMRTPNASANSVARRGRPPSNATKRKLTGTTATLTSAQVSEGLYSELLYIIYYNLIYYNILINDIL